ncbi:MAG TPA: hypothetical protein VF412_18655 [Bdellovibrio sp.]|uniref:hypothetical protein n=1 Tax=Bdellovibrio sp. TaxID=28201 RepID=UPI002EF0D25A
MQNYILVLTLLLSINAGAYAQETDGVCFRGSLQHKKSWYLKLYDGKMLLLANVAIINPDGGFVLQEAFLDWTGAKEGVVGYEKVKEKQTFEYVVENGEHKKRTLTLYKYTPKCQEEIKKRMKTDKPWKLSFE